MYTYPNCICKAAEICLRYSVRDTKLKPPMTNTKSAKRRIEILIRYSNMPFTFGLVLFRK